MKTNIDMFGTGVELLVASKSDGGLRIGKEGHGILFAVDFRDKSSKPDSFFGGVRCGNIFSFGGREGDDWLAFGTPGYGATVDKEGEARDGVAVFICHSIGVGVARDGVFLFAVNTGDKPQFSWSGHLGKIARKCTIY